MRNVYGFNSVDPMTTLRVLRTPRGRRDAWITELFDTGPLIFHCHNVVVTLFRDYSNAGPTTHSGFWIDSNCGLIVDRCWNCHVDDIPREECEMYGKVFRPLAEEDIKPVVYDHTQSEYYLKKLEKAARSPPTPASTQTPPSASVESIFEPSTVAGRPAVPPAPPTSGPSPLNRAPVDPPSARRQVPAHTANPSTSGPRESPAPESPLHTPRDDVSYPALLHKLTGDLIASQEKVKVHEQEQKQWKQEREGYQRRLKAMEGEKAVAVTGREILERQLVIVEREKRELEKEAEKHRRKVPRTNNLKPLYMEDRFDPMAPFTAMPGDQSRPPTANKTQDTKTTQLESENERLRAELLQCKGWMDRVKQAMREK